MGLGKLIDAAAREHRHRLLGEDIAAAVRGPGRAQLSAQLAAPSRLGNMLDESLNDQSCRAHDSVEVRTTTIEEVAGLQQQVKQQSGRRLCPGPAEHESPLTAFNTSALHSSSAVAAEEHEDASYSVPHVEQTRCRTATIPSEEAGGLVMPVFVRHFSGEMEFNVSMNDSPYDLMQLYARRTQTRLDSQYFLYKRRRLEPHHTWLSSGLTRDTTVHVCTRLLGGDHPNLQEYINNNKDKFIETVSLPDGRLSLQMTPIGCQFLSSWIRCFTAQFIQGRSWNGEFELVNFKFVEGHVRPKVKGKVHGPSAMEDDIIKLVDQVRRILNFSHIPNVVSSHPPYVQSCMKMLCDLVGPLSGPFTDKKNGHLLYKYKVLLDTLVCCMTSNARQTLIMKLYRKFEGADSDESSAWDKAIKDASCKVPQLSDLSNTTVFGYFIGKESYSFETGAFTLLRDVVMHASDRSGNPSAPKLGDGIELMIPATLEDFLPALIKNLIDNDIDISTELSAAISCACNICDA